MHLRLPSGTMPPATPPRKRHISYGYDTDTLNKPQFTGALQRGSGHRKSSIPFADRSPKVRFLRQVEPHGENDHGVHQPLPEEDLDSFRPILKKTDFPILVDMKSLEMGVFPDGQSTNDELEGCANFVEHIIQYFSKGEREARGAMDILTFPVATGSVEPLSRFEGSMVVALLALEKLPQVIVNDEKGYVTDIIKLTDVLLLDIENAEQSAKVLLKKTKRRHKEWSSLLSRKGEFKVEHPVAKVPIYAKKTMPENVTLYEDVLAEDKRYQFDGSIRIYRTNHDIVLSTDIKENVYTKYPEEIDDEQLFVITDTVLKHAGDLIYYATEHLNYAFKTLNEKIFDTAYTGVRDRISNIEFDAFFDPLCALELKNSLGDVVARKGELLNTVQHISTYFKIMRNFTKLFRKFSKQIENELRVQKKSRGSCCGLCKPLTVEKLLDNLPGLGNKDFMISIPLTDRFQRIIFSMEPSEHKLIPTQPDKVASLANTT